MVAILKKWPNDNWINVYVKLAIFFYLLYFMMYLVTNSKGNMVLIHLAASWYQSLFLPIIVTDVSTLLGCALFIAPNCFVWFHLTENIWSTLLYWRYSHYWCYRSWTQSNLEEVLKRLQEYGVHLNKGTVPSSTTQL